MHGFTAMSEKLDPEDVQTIVDRCFKILTSEIERHGGYIDKYEGDRIMALFGSHRASEADSENALRAALNMQERFEQINTYLSKQGIKVGIRIGLNTGLVVTGAIGKGREQDFTVMGDAVNLASRLETAAPVGAILISDETRHAAGELFKYETQGKIKVKGKQEPIQVYTVEGLKPLTDEPWKQAGLEATSSFVGRNKEVVDFEEKVRGLLENKEIKAHSLGIHGQAGIGKSRFVYEALERLSQNNLSLDIVKGRSPSVALPHGTFIEILKSVLGISFHDEMGSEDFKLIIEKRLGKHDFLVEAYPMLGYLLGVSFEDSKIAFLDPQALQVEIHLALKSFFRACANRSKSEGKDLFVVRIEDLQRADSGFFDTLQFLLANMELPVSLLFLLVFRSDWSQAPKIKELDGYQEMTLDPFGEGEVAEMFANMLNGFVLEGAFSRQILKRSGGNPLFIEELVHSMINQGIFKKVDEEWKLDEKGEWTIPDTVNRLILSRIDLLDRESKKALQGASVLGEECEKAVLCSMVEKLGEAQLSFNDRLHNLIRQGFLRETRRGVVFANPLIRDVAYATLLNHNKRILHELAGLAIEETYGDEAGNQAVLLAHHFVQAGSNQKALQYSKRALQIHAREYNNEEGLDVADRILELYGNRVGEAEEQEDLFEVMSSKLGILERMGRRSEQRLCLTKMKEMATLPLMQVKVLLGEGRYYLDTGEFKEAMESAEAGLALLKDDSFKQIQCQLIQTMGIIHHRQNRYQEAMEISKEIETIPGAPTLFGMKKLILSRVIAFALPILVMMAGIFGLVFGFDNYPPLDTWKLFLTSVKLSIPVWFVFSLIAFVLIKGRSSSHYEFLAYLIISVVSFGLGGFGEKLYFNGYLDKSPAKIVTTSILKKKISRGDKSTTYYLLVKSWRLMKDQEKIRVPYSFFNRSKPSQHALRITTKPGYYHFEWIHSYSLVSHPRT
jgi:class 3 adenylate cyclase/tetratricopeptide (TPR) repeat protein